ncbi:MAG: aminotransferase class I/II-fold pyridoxal phosphate-dependent enzyme [Nostoc sp.]|uniref:aminotransferase class I/II-fold pyridoxal phosphate-dependent enzyme n=1 Tax=Nostoc sp. TaxID=1180 RepID=UPI002FF4CEA0
MLVSQNRRDIIVNRLQSLGWPIQPPKTTLYVWTPVPLRYALAEFVTLLLNKCSIIVYLCSGYGASGEGFFRIALTISDERLQKGIQRMKYAGIRYA